MDVDDDDAAPASSLKVSSLPRYMSARSLTHCIRLYSQQVRPKPRARTKKAAP